MPKTTRRPTSALEWDARQRSDYELPLEHGDTDLLIWALQDLLERELESEEANQATRLISLLEHLSPAQSRPIAYNAQPGQVELLGGGS